MASASTFRWSRFRYHISNGDPRKGRRGKAKLEAGIAVCRDCGGQYVGGILHSVFCWFLPLNKKRTFSVESWHSIGVSSMPASACIGAAKPLITLSF
jgi:hypothetical protein